MKLSPAPTSSNNHLSTSGNKSFLRNVNANDSATLSNLSNNMSLNLSIHTAEEFGIEMLEWLNNETKSSATSYDPNKLSAATNATLVQVLFIRFAFIFISYFVYYFFLLLLIRLFYSLFFFFKLLSIKTKTIKCVFISIYIIQLFLYLDQGLLLANFMFISSIFFFKER